MMPFIAVFSALILLAGVWSIPDSHTLEDHNYQHSMIDLLTEDNVLRSDAFTKIKDNKVLHIVSIQDDKIPNPIVLRFQGSAGYSKSFSFAIAGTIDLLSVQKINEAMNDNLLSPYLLLNNDPLTLNIDVLSSNEAFAIIRSCNSGRTQLLAKR
ncbi:hypothetical protein ACKVMW_05040 [Vibrio chagasii]|jgi:hypothetical protein|uniref:hypothetical protein n=1 Tax=Vibrio chagasii TaxID=170679 RepID=UPI003DA059D1